MAASDFYIFGTTYDPETFKELCDDSNHCGYFDEQEFIGWLTNSFEKKETPETSLEIMERGNDDCFYSVEDKTIPYRVLVVRWKNIQTNALIDFEVEIFQHPGTKLWIARNFHMTYYTIVIKWETFWQELGKFFPLDIKEPAF